MDKHKYAGYCPVCKLNLSSTEPYIESNETDRKTNTFIGRWGLIIIAVS